MERTKGSVCGPCAGASPCPLAETANDHCTRSRPVATSRGSAVRGTHSRHTHVVGPGFGRGSGYGSSHSASCACSPLVLITPAESAIRSAVPSGTHHTIAHFSKGYAPHNHWVQRGLARVCQANQHHHASLLKSSAKQVNCVGQSTIALLAWMNSTNMNAGGDSLENSWLAEDRRNSQ